MRSPDEIMEEIANIEYETYYEGGRELLEVGDFIKAHVLRWTLDRHCNDALIKHKCIAKVAEQGLELKPEYEDNIL